MKQELSDQLSYMCESWNVSPVIECMILELMHDAYQNGWEDGRTDSDRSNGVF
jgi:hypothetical protein